MTFESLFIFVFEEQNNQRKFALLFALEDGPFNHKLLHHEPNRDKLVRIQGIENFYSILLVSQENVFFVYVFLSDI